MFRKELVDFLLHNPMSVSEIAKGLRIPFREVIDDLEHVRKSLKRSDYLINIEPAFCHKCGFLFSSTKFSKPGKCPKCRSQWIGAPLIEIVRK